MNELEKILNINFPKDIEITFATNSTFKIEKNSIFFGLPGTNNHGSKFCEEAIKLGAVIAVHNDPEFITEVKNIFYVEDLESKISPFLCELYQIDINHSKYFGFTGTNGKTSSAYFCHQILNNQGHPSLYIGTLGVYFNQEKSDKIFSTKTTPDIFELFTILNFFGFGRTPYMDGFEVPVNICIEISSHALDQGRLNDIDWFNATSILNISSDHLDYHKKISAYRDAKFEIFKNKSLVKLLDDKSYKFHHKYDFIVNDENKILVISKDNNFSDIYYEIKEISIKETTFEISINKPSKEYNFKERKKFKFCCNVFPDFNVHNLVFAICSIGFGGFLENKINDLNYLRLPKGRAEIIRDIPSNIIIDYAHNHEAIRLFLSSIKNQYDNLIVIIGCGGGRDKSKRSKMLSAAIRDSSKVIFTSDNSRSEDFEDIFKDAVKNNNIENVVKIKDRKQAIIFGTKEISNNDCLVILGKGHEETQEENNQISYFSDHEVVNEIYN